MASMARQMSRDPFGFDLQGLVREIFSGPAGHAGGPADLLAGEVLTSRAVAAAGLAALLALPPLLLSSVLLAAPLAVPAAIGICYLAVSHALSAQRLRLANLIYSAILCGLVGWLIGFLLEGEEQLSYAGLAAALMAPVFAAAPAFARSLISRRAVPQGTVASRSSMNTFSNDAAPIRLDLTFDTMKAERSLPAMLSPCGDDAVAMRLHERSAINPPAAGVEERTGAGANEVARIGKPPAPTSDIGEAVAFAINRSSRKAKSKKLRVTSALDADIAAACDRQVARRIVHLLIDGAFDGCEADGTVHIFSRRLKGVVLLRTTTLPRKDAIEIKMSSKDESGMAALQTLVDDAGGTLVADHRDEERVVSVRLPLAPMRAIVPGEATP